MDPESLERVSPSSQIYVERGSVSLQPPFTSVARGARRASVGSRPREAGGGSTQENRNEGEASYSLRVLTSLNSLNRLYPFNRINGDAPLQMQPHEVEAILCFIRQNADPQLQEVFLRFINENTQLIRQNMQQQQTIQDLSNQNRLLQLTGQVFVAQTTQLQQTNQAVTDQEAQLQQENQVLTGQNAEQQRTIQTLTNEQAQVRQKNQTLTDQITQLQQENQVLTGQKAEQQREIQTLTNEQTQVRQENKEFTTQLQQTLQALIKQNTQQQQKNKVVTTQQQQTIQTLTNQITQLQQENQVLTGQKAEQERAIQTLINEKAQVRQENQAIADQKVAQQQTIQTLTDQITQLQQENQAIADQKVVQQQTIQTLTNQITQLPQENQAVIAQKAQLQQTIQMLTDQITQQQKTNKNFAMQLQQTIQLFAGEHAPLLPENQNATQHDVLPPSDLSIRPELSTAIKTAAKWFRTPGKWDFYGFEPIYEMLLRRLADEWKIRFKIFRGKNTSSQDACLEIGQQSGDNVPVVELHLNNGHYRIVFNGQKYSVPADNDCAMHVLNVVAQLLTTQKIEDYVIKKRWVEGESSIELALPTHKHEPQRIQSLMAKTRSFREKGAKLVQDNMEILAPFFTINALESGRKSRNKVSEQLIVSSADDDQPSILSKRSRRNEASKFKEVLSSANDDQPSISSKRSRHNEASKFKEVLSSANDDQRSISSKRLRHNEASKFKEALSSANDDQGSISSKRSRRNKASKFKEALKRIEELYYKQGKTCTEIYPILNAEKRRTQTGKKWDRKAVSRAIQKIEKEARAQLRKNAHKQFNVGLRAYDPKILERIWYLHEKGVDKKIIARLLRRSGSQTPNGIQWKTRHIAWIIRKHLEDFVEAPDFERYFLSEQTKKRLGDLCAEGKSDSDIAVILNNENRLTQRHNQWNAASARRARIGLKLAPGVQQGLPVSELKPIVHSIYNNNKNFKGKNYYAVSPEMAEMLNEAGVYTTLGKEWTAENIRNFLRKYPPEVAPDTNSESDR